MSPRPVLLVIDDLDRLLEARAAPDSSRALLALAPAELRLLLITRSDRRLGLHRLRVAGELTEIRGEDLAFTVEEADELLTAAGIQLSEESLARLHDRTEGWAAVCAWPRCGSRAAPIPTASSTDSRAASERVAEYLTGEVLAGQRRRCGACLRRTSVLERVNGPLANLLTGRSDGERMLQDLEAANAFVTSIDPARTWFRYHPLLTDLLRMELRRDAPEEIETLHRAAARWHAAHGTGSRRSATPRRGGTGGSPPACWSRTGSDSSWRTAARDSETSWPRFRPTRAPRTPSSRRSLRPTASRPARSTSPMPTSRWPSASRGSVPESRRPRFDVTLAVVKLERARTRGDTPTMIEIASALRTPARGDHLGVDADLRAFALMSIGLAEFWALELDDAERDLQESLELARRIGRPYIAIACLGYLAHIANLREEADVAEDRSREAIELADRLGWSQDPVVGGAYLALGGGVLLRGRLEQAELWLDRATRALSGVRDPEASVSLPFTRGILRFAQGRYDEALRASAMPSARPPRTSCPPRREPGGCVPASASATRRPLATRWWRSAMPRAASPNGATSRRIST